eukprot:Nitzschia sp. Nitz4//scaffold9_size221794//64787//75082//NITZ4_001337-RA/size221794-augustus-gene-0.161-mRNA-1//-1//CDS//3329560974//2344//frame0
MPKRRLGYSQVGGTTSPKDSGHKRTVEEIPKQAGDSGSSNNDGREALTHSRNMDILLKLSESCRQHADFHKPRAEPINVYDAPDQWPSTCRHDLDTLRNLLPRVEKTFDPSRTCPAQEVASLCDFYATVLRGDHCPYAPHLLDLGRNPKTVTPDVVSSAQSESLSDLTNTVETCLRTIADTIAHFLSFIAETRLALLIVTDLVNMLEDCALLCQVFQNKGSGSIQLSLLEKTRRAAGSDEPMALDLPHLDKVWTLQTAGYLILRDYLRYQHTKRSQEVPLQSGYADVHVSPELCPSSVMTPLLASLRYTMLQSPHDTLTRNRTLAALAVFLQILLDRRYLPDDASQLFETSVLACHLVQFQFMDSKKLAFDLQYQRRLDLVQDIFCLAVVELPVDSRLPSRFLARSILPFMLDCIGSMSHQDQHPLSLVVLEAVLRFLQDPKVIAPQYLLDMTSYCLGHGVLVHLVKLIVASVTGDLPKSSGTKRKRDKPQSPIKPLALACCLLSALYEPENKASLFLDSILDLWSSTKNQSFFPVAVACTFVPTWLRRRLHNSDSFRTLLSSLLSDVLLPIAQDCSQLSGQVCKGLLQATVEVQHCMMELNNTSLHPPSSLCSLDSFGILKQLLLISPRASFPGDLQKPSPQDQESISTVHRIVGILFEGIPKDHGSVDVRKLRWVCMVHDVIPFMSGGDSGLLQGPSKDGADKPVWLWLVEASMLDPSEEMRTFVAQQIVPIILTEDGSFLLSQIASREEVRETKALSYNQPSEKTVDSVTTKFFHFFDKLLHSTVGVSTSQLTFSVATSSGTQTSWKDKELRLQVQRVACRLLASFCLQSNFDLPFPKSVFERSFQRLVRLWASSTHEEGMDVLFPVSPYYSTRKALAFGGCSGVYMQKLDCLQALQQVSPGYIATVMGDIFVLGCNVNKEVLFLSLECFLRAMFQKEATRFIQGIHSVKAVSSFLECELPYTVAQLVTEKDIALLHLVTGFRQFLVERAKHLRGKVSCQVVGASNLVARWAYPSTGLSSNDLKSKTKSMCLEPVLLEKLLPVLFISSDKEGLSFFTREVVPGKTLHELTKQKEQLALKGLAWELGRDQTSFGPAKLGIRAAAVAVAVNMRRGNQEQASVSGISLGKNWVTSHFMYLLVTVVQYRWNARTLKERLHAVRSLYNLLDFLLPEEAAQYVPQVMATVNAAILDGNPSKWGFETEKAQSGNLRLLAVECLSTFVKLVAETQYETIAQNLTAIVVSLIPVIVEEGTSTRSKSFISTARDAAVGLLEFLVQGDLGRRLAPHLTRVPFLPAVPALEGVHRALRQIGVDFDNLYALSFSTQRAGDMAKQYSNADTLESASSASMGIPSFSRLAALQKRLSLVLGLLDNENVSVRGIALQHVTDLLQGNRNLYHHLVRSEELSNGKHFLTVVFTDQGGNSKWTSSGVVTRMIQKLLGRCVVESDSGCRLRLAVCLGEVGAIAEGRLGDLQVGSSMGHETIDSPNSSYNWRLNQPPWQSQVVKYQLQLVTNNLVAALKAAASTTEQHKISFSVQQLLRQLNKVGEQENSSPNNRKMTKWLEETLQEKGVLDLVEPFFQSDFKEKSRDVQDDKQPPFYRLSLSLNSWLAKFCHWMIQRSHRTEMSPWSELFFACRTAVRTEAGIDIAEFILPLLVLDRICFGTLHEIGLLRNEFVDVLKMDSPDLMDPADRHRATNVLFRTLDTLRVWSDREIEGQFKRRASTATSRGRREASTIPTDSGQVQSWPVDEAVDKIGEFLKDLPSILQAQAAAKIGMNARALRNLELHIREKRVVHLFEKSVNEQKRDELETDLQNLAGVSIPWEVSDLMVNMLHRLDDFETMMAIGRSSSLFNQARYIQDNIKAKEAVSDFESAIQEYERALQIPHDKLSRKLLETGSLRCLLELGRYESVLNQVRGLIHHSTEDTDLENLNSIAVEAAWKLGRWDTLSDLLESVGQSSPGKLSGVGDDYETQFGRAMLGLHNKDHGLVEDSIRRARESVLHSLSSAAAESYTRSYADITRLQCLRELENTDAYFHDDTRSKHSSFRDMTQTSGLDTWCWDGRAELVSSFAVSSVSTTRVALSRVHDEKVLAGSIFLNSGKRARKNKQTTTAENLLFQSQAILDMVVPQDRCPEFYILVHSTQEQLAKLKHDNGDNAVALQMLRYDILDTAVNEMLEHGGSPSKHADLAARFEMRVSDRKVELNSKQLVSRFARRLLQVTTWEAGVGLKGCSDIMSRFRLVLELAPTWEKGHFQFGKYVDTLLQSRMTGLGNKLVASKELQLGIDEDEMRSEVLWRDKVCQKYAILAMQQYAASLKIDVKHVYQALPRVLSLWFDLVSVNTSKYSDGAEGQLESLHRIQNQANAFMAGQVKDIPAIAFYTTMPQLISRVTHDNIETSLVVKSILQRVLIKFPQQALWTLAWLKGSVKPERSAVGEEIFKDAQKMLAKNHKSMSDLLAAAQSLFRFLRELAVYQGSSERRHSNVLQVRPWQSTEVELSDFVPPIQAALSVSSLSGSSQSTRDHFPRAVPRMRAFSSRVGVMASKAKPKKLKAYAVPGTYRAPKGQQSDSGAKARGRHDDVDIGELHFLVKQEAKGDLRKDARVQDLNNMINRLMTIPDDSDAASRMRRRLNLRTFAVTCLSEDICILEWVPNTDSLRNLVSKSYNPQTSAHCTRRRGNRIANFGDATLRSHYEMSQNKYFKDGNLSKAAAMFEDHCLRQYPPLLYWWFVQTFHDPHAWYEARTRFTLSAAAWSAVGHVIGLGDRHSENILVDTTNGECVHVDFDCIFDKGLHLPRPEVVPFRLTANMIDAFGPTGAEGLYEAGLRMAMHVLRDNRDTLLSVLEPFLKDPVIDWKRQKSRTQQAAAGTASTAQERQSQEAKRSIKVIDERLQGYYNLRNPNLRKYRRTDQTEQHDEMSHLVPLSVEGQVRRMIQEATSNENLVQLYVGWMPWL